jgi:large-conductance mechanosensitive channel
MLQFLTTEGILGAGVLAGGFTNHMLESLKMNILHPISEKFLPSHLLDNDDKDTFINIAPVTIKWQTFLKDFIIWLLIMYIIYNVSEKIFAKYKKPILPTPLAPVNILPS